jgi:hypothetical protein
LDVIGSVVWGNPLASDASLSVTANFSIFLDKQLYSCIASQVVLALHFVYVACQSCRGRGWAYASLRFELDECGKSLLMSTVPTMTSCLKDSGTTASAATPMLALDVSAPAELQHTWRNTMESALSIAAALAAVPAAASVALPRVCCSLRRDA